MLTLKQSIKSRCPECSIYQYRAQTGGGLHVDFLPLKPLIIGLFTKVKTKNAFSYGNGIEAPQNSVFNAMGAV